MSEHFSGTSLELLPLLASTSDSSKRFQNPIKLHYLSYHLLSIEYLRILAEAAQ
jgi:hypothetical protein